VASIQTIDESAADGEVAALYRKAGDEPVPNSLRAFSIRPDVYEAWEQLKNAVASGMDPRRYELATLSAARKLRSSYCCLAHGRVLAERFLDPETVRAFAIGSSAGLNPAEVAIMDFAGKVAGDASSITQADVQHLRDLGLDDREIFDVVVAAAARCFFSKTLDALGALPDVEFAELEPGLRGRADCRASDRPALAVKSSV
jgi:uncharacterized peroxidase-related enzyme